MLQMKCPECEGVIRSNFLAEMATITCNWCDRNVTVKDVVVTNRYFTMHRDSLLKRVRHYRALLEELERGKRTLGNSDTNPKASPNSLDQYYTGLQELLAASRENYRLAIFQDVPVGVEWRGSKGDGRLLNLSTRGAAIKPNNLRWAPHKGLEITLKMALPDFAEPLTVSAKIAWVGKLEKKEEQSSITMGVTFVNLSEHMTSCIWNFVSASNNA